MEFTRTQFSAADPHNAEANQVAAPDWHGLQARFAAAHAVRRELQRLAGERPVRLGGFERWSTASGAGFTPVNQDNSADGKDAGGMRVGTVGQVHSGDRGKQ